MWNHSNPDWRLWRKFGKHGEQGEQRRERKHHPDELKHSIYDSKVLKGMSTMLIVYGANGLIGEIQKNKKYHKKNSN